VRVAVFTVFLNFALNITLVWLLKEAGIALATAISGFVNLVVLTLILVKRFREFIDTRGIKIIFIKTTVLAVIMSGVVMSIYKVLGQTGYGIIGQIFIIVISIGFGVSIYLGLSLLLGIEEAKELLRANHGTQTKR
jgi:peptidoglycan biosynthesis protein MviN/MurJ (putative lipid II flippase)